MDKKLSTASDAMGILHLFGVPPNYLVSPSRRNFYQDWFARGVTFRELIDACFIGLNRRREDQDSRPLGVAYLDKILLNPQPGQRDDGQAMRRAEEAFVNG